MVAGRQNKVICLRVRRADPASHVGAARGPAATNRRATVSHLRRFHFEVSEYSLGAAAVAENRGNFAGSILAQPRRRDGGK